MRRIVGLVCLVLAGLLLVSAVLSGTWLSSSAKRTPVVLDTKTYLTGEAAAVPVGDPGPVQYFSHTVTNPDKSDGDNVVFSTFTCLTKVTEEPAPDCVDANDPDKRLVNAGTDNFVTDRRSALALNADQTKKILGDDAEPHEGLVNKFPFNTEKKTYPFWDGVLQRSIDANFEGVENLDGVEVYKFTTSAVDEPAEISEGIQGLYTTEGEMWVDPVTGSMLKQAQHQVRKLDGQTMLDVNLVYTDDTIKANVEDAKDNASRLGMLSALPWVLLPLGLILLVLGFFLIRSGRSQAAAPAGERTRTRRQ
ncbi:DUF3068 domain-containing protein [Janibacter sp. GXQ6167]|uniref:DUF3068 domain-containing protein n=1 Tax=Janibacter sp. GXQ6167 TaxID=3240791 RepID=UPI003523F685